MFSPSLDEVRSLRQELEAEGQTASGRIPLVPLYRDVLADTETPVSAYCKTARGPYTFLLESVEGGERIARYSFIGIDPYLVLIQDEHEATLRYLSYEDGTQRCHSLVRLPSYDPLHLIEQQLGRYRLLRPRQGGDDALPRFYGGAVGYLAYEVASRFERLPVPAADELGLPLAIFSFTETVLAFDHLKHRLRVITHLHLDAPDLEAEYRRCQQTIEGVVARLQEELRLPTEPEPVYTGTPTVTSSFTREEYEAMVRRAKEYIAAGDIFQVVPSQRLRRPVNAAPFTVYRALRTINPSPYMFYLDLEDFVVLGASPELLVRVDEGEVTIHPIAGTRPRGSDPESDRRLEEELRHDPKERAEHVMLVDLGRNDVGRVSLPGSVSVSQFMEIERYSHVMHLVSNVVGRLRPELTPFDALRAGFPAGTVTGAPKIRAMEIISELEGMRRGVYAGAVGYFSHSGNLDTAIALRTMVMKNGHAYIQAGGGVVADSDPAAEYQESMNKARALLRAVEMAEEMARAQRPRYAHT
ncbi:MAG: anthranilate synthase component I [Thermogemmatispora sp.]|uniref:anthranilate synthase component I n=1 Tax=Thermogemmatispora sp. TaxID=1968838 RepID=UPI002617AE11|nr:anthranilate synthase component I [Thermogemmatispora sp.]MBX5458591.1 anthranilate synthase component I [Thermogemmatispora sp.]